MSLARVETETEKVSADKMFVRRMFSVLSPALFDNMLIFWVYLRKLFATPRFV